MFDPSPKFLIENVDLNTIQQVYPNLLPKLGLSQAANNGNDGVVRVKVGSAVVIKHSNINQFNDLFEQYEHSRNQQTRKAIELARKEYEEKVYKLGNLITNDIKNEFLDGIFVNGKIKAVLEPVSDTLFFCCLMFYNLCWDAFGTDFNGPVATTPLAELDHARQPYQYRSNQQLKFLVTLLYDYISKPGAHLELNITAGGKPHSTFDPNLIDWFIKQINFPLSLDYNGIVLKKILQQKNKVSESEMLNSLKTLKENLDKIPPVESKRKVVKEYCEAIHKIFSHYLGLSVDNYRGKRVKIYHNILRAFDMDNFNKPYRKVKLSAERGVDAGDNRLRVLLRKV